MSEDLASAGNLPPATPAYIFRGHSSALHALHFFSANRYLASADADGWIIVWSLTTKRPVAVWKGHDGSILGIKSWGNEILITHGRDHSLRAWQLRESDFDGLDKTLPAQRSADYQSKDPWLLHSMMVNALNFCAFSIYDIQNSAVEISDKVPRVPLPSGAPNEILLGCPNALDSGAVDLFHLPSEQRVTVLKSDPAVKTGMVMALKLVKDKENGQLTIVAGYEDGHIMTYRRLEPKSGSDWRWQRTYLSRPHSQPVLSLDTFDGEFFISSSADALLVKHPIPSGKITSPPRPIKSVNTKHSGQQGLAMRDDGKIFATAGWDARIRVYSSKSLQELAVLKWHTEGCYSVTFAQTIASTTSSSDGGDSSLVTSQSALAQIKQKRAARAQQTHWLSAGGKDGKISLWDIY